jgi:hypothetical protein
MDNGMCNHCRILDLFQQCVIGTLQAIMRAAPRWLTITLFVADGLSRILKHEVKNGALHKLWICRCVSGISHLLFTDDTLLFLEVMEEQAEVVNNTLQVYEKQADVVNNTLQLYEKCTWQLINPSKCLIMFGSECLPMNKEKVKENQSQILPRGPNQHSFS